MNKHSLFLVVAMLGATAAAVGWVDDAPAQVVAKDTRTPLSLEQRIVALEQRVNVLEQQNAELRRYVKPGVDSLSIESPQDVSIRAGGDLRVMVSSSATIKTGSALAMDASGPANVKGSTVSVHGAQQATVESAGAMLVKGTPVLVNGVPK